MWVSLWEAVREIPIYNKLILGYALELQFRIIKQILKMPIFGIKIYESWNLYLNISMFGNMPITSNIKTNEEIM